MVLFCISLKEKLSAKSAMVEGSVLGSVISVLCKYYGAQATGTRRPLAVSTIWPSNPE